MFGNWRVSLSVGCGSGDDVNCSMRSIKNCDSRRNGFWFEERSETDEFD